MSSISRTPLRASSDFSRVHVDDLAFGHRRRARRRELGRLLDLDEAHAAHAGDRQSRVVAVVRHEHAGVLRRLEDRRARRDGDLPSLDRERYTIAGASAIRPPPARGSMRLRLDQRLEVGAELLDAATRPAPRTSRSARRSSCRSCCRRSTSSVSRSSGVPSPATMRSRIFVVHAVPSRHCVHCAQLSWAKKRAARAICFTRFCASSKHDHAAGAEHRALRDEALVVHEASPRLRRPSGSAPRCRRG